MAPRSLDPKLFRRIFEDVQKHEESRTLTRYTAYAPVGHPLLLFSLVDGMPLAALTLRSRDRSASALITARSAKAMAAEASSSSAGAAPAAPCCDFQGLISKDDQEFELVITNLTAGRINFNILKKQTRVSEVDLGGEVGLNEVNELRSWESYAVAADQSNNRALVLSSLKVEEEVVVNTKGDKMVVTKFKSVGEAEKEAAAAAEENKPPPQPAGTYYFLSVVPELADADLCRRFESTRWSTVDWFYVTKTELMRERPRMKRREVGRGGGGGRGGGRGGGGGLMGGRSRGGGGGGVEEMDFAYSGTLSASAHSSSPYYGSSVRERGEANGGRDTSPDRDCDDGSSSNLRSRSRSRSPAAAKKKMIKCKKRRAAPSSLDADDDDDEEDDGDDMTMRDAAGAKSEQLGFAASAPAVPESVVASSKAAEVRAGQHVQVNSVFTGIEYNYDRASAPCMIGLSVSLGLVPTCASDESLRQAAKDTIALHIAETLSPLIKRLAETFKEEECVLCLDGAPDCVFYTCGHQCVHFACIGAGKGATECPLCRRHIVAKLRVVVGV